MITRILAAAMALAITAGGVAAQTPGDDGRLDLRASPAANTSLVLRPAFSIGIFQTGRQRKGGLTFGGELDWLPRLPAMVNLALFRALDGGGATLHSLLEVGGALRLAERLAVADQEIYLSGRRTRDSVYLTYQSGQTVARKFLAIRGGLMLSRIYEPGTTPPLESAARVAYFGVSRNRLVNDPRGALGVRWIKTLGADVLVGTADSSAIARGRKVGFRGFLRTDWGTGSPITSRVEVGSRPAQGFYAAVTMDFNIMFVGLLRL